MKILLLNHHIDAQHKITARLQAAGAVVLNPSHTEEAWKMIQLHGPSLDLAILHREGETDDALDEGEKLVARIKADPTQSDLPIIFTSSLWNEADFFQHQQGPLGVNAYLRWPFNDDELIETIETMFGNSIRFAAATLTGMSAPLKKPSHTSTSTTAASLSFESLDVKLEETSADSGVYHDPNLKLEMPSALPALEPVGVTQEASAINLADPGPVPSLVLSHGPPSKLPPPAPGKNEISSTATVPLSESGLPDLVDPKKLESSLLQDLEPYERLEIDQQLKASGGPALELAAPEEMPESGTTVLDASSIVIAPADNAPLFDLGALAVSTPSVQDEPQVLITEPTGQDMPVAASSTPASATSGSGDEEDLASELPYLFSGKKAVGVATDASSSALVFSEPVGDAVIPGGAVQSPDTETLKKYLMLREQDVAILSNQLKSARDQIAQLDKKLREETGRGGELEHTVSEHQKRIEEFEKEKALALQGLQAEIDELRFQNKTKSDKARLLESRVNEATEEIERLKERVRTDIRKIRVREKELENKLEIVRKDSEALITARESKIMELKRKIDLLEFNIDLLQDQNAREKENSAQLKERLAKAAQVVRVAGGLLDAQGKAIIEEAVSEKKSAREAS
jgi:DNA-binding response OmpR family regulator